MGLKPQDCYGWRFLLCFHHSRYTFRGWYWLHCSLRNRILSHTPLHIRLLMSWWFDPRKLHGCLLYISPALVGEIDFTFACQKHLCIVYRHDSTGSNWESLLQHFQTIFVFIVTFCLREWERERLERALTHQSTSLYLFLSAVTSPLAMQRSWCFLKPCNVTIWLDTTHLSILI